MVAAWVGEGPRGGGGGGLGEDRRAGTSGVSGSKGGDGGDGSGQLLGSRGYSGGPVSTAFGC